MATHINPAPEEHLDFLDSARGIAAIMVMGGHFISWQFDGRMSTKLLGIVFNAADAVSFFFVLSGFVLSYKYIVLNKPLDFAKFYTNRVFRLWPAFFVAIVVTTLYVLSRTGLTLQGLIDTFVLNKSQFWEEAIIFWSKQNLYGAGWTLVIELGASFFIPFAIVLAKKDRRYLYWLIFVTFIFGRSIGMGFITFFLLGVIISSLYAQICSPAFKETKWYKYRYIVLPVCVILFSGRQLNRISPLGSTLVYVTDYAGISFFTYSAIAAFVFIIALLIFDLPKKILRARPLLFLGKICYGIYLMHWFLMDAAFFYRGQIEKCFSSSLTAYISVFLIYSACTIILATIIHYTVEMPFIRMGKRIAARLKPSLVIE